MKYLFYKVQSEGRAKVQTIYHVDPPKELQEEPHIKVEEIPKAEFKQDKFSILYCNPDTKEVWYEYEEVKESREDRKIRELENQVKDHSIALANILGM